MTTLRFRAAHSIGLAALLASSLAAQVPTAVGDINTDASGFDSNVDGGIQGDNNEFPEDSFIQLGSFWYFTAETLTTGDELWRTDGTAAGTTLVKDINPGPGDSNVTWLTDFFGSKLFFQANDGTNGTELWCTDGTAAGTVMVKDINPTGNSGAARMFAWNGMLWFAADDGVNGTELWTSDGSAAGTNLFADLRAGGSSTPQGFHAVPGGTQMVFRCNDGTNGTELWATDGTVGGTAMLLDIRPGSSSSSPSRFVTLGNLVMFTANDGSSGIELWRTDGTTLGTVITADQNPGSLSFSPDLAYAVVFNNELYFEANDGQNGNEIWKTDGVNNTMVWDLNPNGSSNPSDFHTNGTDLYFTADDFTVVGRELRRITAAGVQETLGDIRPGTADAFSFSNNNLLPHNGRVFFKCNDGTTGAELGFSDGTAAGTILLSDLDPGSASTDPNWFTPINATQVMFVADTVANGQELWITDGTAAGTSLLVEIDATLLTADGQPEGIFSFNGKDMLFQARTATEGEELWKWDPISGITMVKDIRPGTNSSSIDNMVDAWINGAHVVLFSANDGVNGTELWKTDGTAAGTVMVKDIRPGSGSGSPDDLIYWNGLVYFRAIDGVTGSELWATDGTDAGTVQIADIQVGTSSSAPQQFCIHQDRLYFRANDGGTGVGSGNELWATDGTTAGTVLVADIRPGGAASTPTHLTSFGNVLVFRANDGTTGTELWMSDGTAAGTVQILDLAPGSSSSSPEQLTPFNGLLYFRADDTSTFGRELWLTDLTAAGTIAIDINPGGSDSNPSRITRVNDKLWFTASDGVNGSEMWTSDGTPGGTNMVVDLRPGSSGSLADDITPVSIGIYFSATDGVTGNELYFSDGTAGGTVLISDIWPGITGSNPTHLTMANGSLFFQADDPIIGKELFVLTPPGAYARSIGHSGDGTQLDCTAPALGQTWSWSFTNAPSGAISVRVFGLPLDAPSGIAMAAESSSWVDLFASPAILDFSVASSGGGSLVVPNNPALIGTRNNIQSLSLPASITPFASSNAMTTSLGN